MNHAVFPVLCTRIIIVGKPVTKIRAFMNSAGYGAPVIILPALRLLELMPTIQKINRG